ncbi:hypothetical protein OG320_22100 [Microbispora sp. NBC_01189]|uniref:hypothetical protein n=1 Tax=Microbispora sp. NBC_01189 TaxID=2903583 RepID=UPI002E12A643|nr:hypothetical protein OG320_22100 [Microbispora sp. NBC_01189]
MVAYLLLVTIGIARAVHPDIDYSGELLRLVTSPLNEVTHALPIRWVDLTNEMQSAWPLMAPDIIAGILQAWLLWVILRGSPRKAADDTPISLASDFGSLRISLYWSGALVMLLRLVNAVFDLAPASAHVMGVVAGVLVFVASATFLYISLMFYRVSLSRVNRVYSGSSLVLGGLLALAFLVAGVHLLTSSRLLSAELPFAFLGSLSPIFYVWLLSVAAVQWRSAHWSRATISLGLIAAFLGLLLAVVSYYLGPDRQIEFHGKWGYLCEFVYFAWAIQSGHTALRHRRHSPSPEAVQT